MRIGTIKGLFLLLFCLMAFSAILFSPLFNIQKIVPMHEGVPQDVLIHEVGNIQVGDNLILHLLSGGGLLDLRFSETEQLLQDQNQNMADIVVKGVLPNRLEVRYILRKEAFEILYGNTLLVTDETGFVLDSRPERTLGLLRLRGIQVSQFFLGKPILENDERFRYAAKVFREINRYDTTRLTAFREHIDWLDVTFLDRIILQFDGRIVVRFSEREDFSYQVASMCILLAENIGSREKGTLDYRYPYPVFSPR